MKKILLSGIVCCLSFCLCGIQAATPQDSVAGISGRRYPTIQIGKQVWMAENLAEYVYDTQSERYGDTLADFGVNGYSSKSLPYYIDHRNVKTKSDSLLTPDSRAKMGFQYNWLAAAGLTAEEGEHLYLSTAITLPRQGICPNGWHLPTLDEWKVLFAEAGGRETGALLLKDSVGWSAHAGNNLLGFNALPSGTYYTESRDSLSVGKAVSFWTITPSGSSSYPSSAYYISMDAQSDAVNYDHNLKWNGRGCRCVKNEESTPSGIPQVATPDIPIKRIQNGQLVILTADGTAYNILGTKLLDHTAR
ncbi:MAG: fibrobacter succinogenes major paralogous domain-containing protein [Paludibacteraceae bacterium]